ncbi:MAG: type I secretion system permease/ATPase [Candidatus Margulisiibacteriota bacterium]|nr:MAG: peptidase C39 [Candidatus Margulisbacteria bacterium GWD2_39_127]OGI01890.1 MAG: peptidase C39 [Candidatus Margulisbacteria bacterium GWF2_38_17]OGI11335.1 MAG: peptidase C39 [Candidatus Margulisbacteria bacterium GWE2_39_32]PZM79856.1 MAG: type I secretion system permease/ATPase [Candidatus Margulisiibacteriota bacterium]HAR62767.1 type I secretion system permease/ATPase [Candidatus Margulisiibacteriota bacterium]
MHTGLISFEVVARINQLDIDLRSIVRQYGITNNDITREELLLIAKNLEFRARIKQFVVYKLARSYPLPAIAILNDNSYCVILKVNQQEKKILVFLPKDKETREISISEFESIATNEFVVLRHRAFSSSIKFGLLWFYQEILKFKQVIFEVMLGSFVVQLFGLVTPLFTQVILDKVIVHRSVTTLDVLAFAFIAIIVFEFLLNITRNYIFLHTANKIDSKLSAKLFRHLFSLPFVYFEVRKVGNIISRIRELDSIREFLTNKSVSVIIDLFFSIVFLAVMFAYSSTLTFMVLVFITSIALLYLVITPEVRKRLEAKFQMAAQSNSYLIEAVTGIQTVKSLAIEGSMQKKWEEHLGGYIHSSFKLSNIMNITGSLSKVLQKLMTIAILYLGVKLVINNKLTIGQLIAFNMFAGQLTAPIIRLVNLWNEFQQALMGIKRLGDILNQPAEQQSSKAITLPSVNGAVKLDNVSFKYTPNGPKILDDISLSISPGLCIGIIGRSGSGKSTVTKLIQRLYLTNEGAIYLDDIDIRHMNPYWLRNNIGVVLQESFLFSGSIRENIALPRPDAPIEMIIEAAKVAGAHEFIAQLSEGYDTFVGERGSSLSGGQKQRIAIARAIITNPRILIFDEATSALDYESEKIISTNLNKIKKGRTTFIIAHRLSTVRRCDMIIALDKGKIIEKGTHDQLIANKGYYHHLFTQQESSSD